jgi:hypothetical protein
VSVPPSQNVVVALYCLFLFAEMFFEELTPGRGREHCRRIRVSKAVRDLAYFGIRKVL